MGPFVLGGLLGAVSVIVPDHLVVLITMSVGMKSIPGAFRTGVSWGFGHCFGMLLVLLVSIPLQRLIHSAGMHRVGDYLAGMLLITVGSFFLMFEKRYLEQKEDGSYVAKPCSCHGPAVSSPRPAGDDAHNPENSNAFCASFSAGGHRRHRRGYGHTGSGHFSSSGHGHGHEDLTCSECSSDIDGEDLESPEQEPLVPKVQACPSAGKGLAEKSVGADTALNIRGAVLGMLQGMCCPGCMLGIGFASEAGPGTWSTLAMCVTFVATTSLLTGFVSVSVAYVGSQGTTGKATVSRQLLYRCSCVLTIFLGCLWIVLNNFNLLWIMEFGDRFLHAFGAEHMGHDHHHHHHDA